jgi:hypothetical protein
MSKIPGRTDSARSQWVMNRRAAHGLPRSVSPRKLPLQPVTDPKRRNRSGLSKRPSGRNLSRRAKPIAQLQLGNNTCLIEMENHRDRSGDGLFLGGHFKAR